MGSDSDSTSSSVDLKKKNSKIKPFVCHYEGCLSEYSRKWKLARHICSHTKERPFKCDYPECKKDYTSKAHLTRHVSIIHQKKNAPTVFIPCPYPGCMKQFQNKYSLKKHCKNHLVENEYKCPDCDLVFKKKRQLTFHSVVHSKTLSFICPTCNEGFATRPSLISHETKHKSYMCEYEDCHEQFSLWSLYRRHLKVKHPRNYFCNFCNRSYFNKNTLMKHILTHLDDSSQLAFPCPYSGCLRYYKHKSNLTHHIRTSHEGKTYNCIEENCKMTFKSKNRLVDHQMRHKNGTLNAPRVKSTKKRKPRKDKGLPRKSMATILSGIPLPMDVDKCLAQNTVSSYVEESIKSTIDTLRRLDENNEEEQSIKVVDNTPEKTSSSENEISNSILYFCKLTKIKN